MRRRRIHPFSKALLYYILAIILIGGLFLPKIIDSIKKIHYGYTINSIHKQKANEIKSHNERLKTEIKKLESPFAIESERRYRFGYRKDGEGSITIYDTPIDDPSLPFTIDEIPLFDVLSDI